MGTIPIGDKYAQEGTQRMFDLFSLLEERRNQLSMIMSDGEQKMPSPVRSPTMRSSYLIRRSGWPKAKSA